MRVRVSVPVIVGPLLALLMVVLVAAPSAAEARPSVPDRPEVPDEPTVPEEPVGGIIGGTPTTRAAHPYFVGVGTRQIDVCGGSLITPIWVLTAAHCVDTIAGPTVSFATGRVPVSEVVLHPEWNGDSNDGHDLALLRLAPGLSDGDTIQVGEPDRPRAYLAGQSATLVGAGVTNPRGGLPSALNQVTIQIRSDNDMESIYDPWYRPFQNHYHPSLMIGAGSTTKTACSGDSGAPLTTFRGGRLIQIGVLSYGATFCNQPAVYSELDNAHLAWIATEVPDIIGTWSLCIAGGRPGTPVVLYEPGNAGPNRDGSHSWDLTCRANTPPPPPPPDDPPPPDGDPPPPPCLSNRQRRCPLDL